jgi:hypothetical protein
MKFFLPLLFCILLSSVLSAQQNFFNVPSSDITERKKIFFQQQLNFFNEGLQSNSTFDVGLGHNLEIGVNFLGFSVIDQKGLEVPIDDTIKPYNPFFLLNLQKGFPIGEKMMLGIGTQYGITTTAITRKGGYYYSNLTYGEKSVGLKLVFGLYAASKSFFGEGKRSVNNTIGCQAGIEKSIIKDKLVFQADFISGKHNLGEVVLGGAMYLSKNWILSAGYQIPTFGSKSIRAIVFELTYNPHTGALNSK